MPAVPSWSTKKSVPCPPDQPYRPCSGPSFCTATPNPHPYRPRSRGRSCRGLVLRRHLIAGQLLHVIGREQNVVLQTAAVDQQTGEAVEVGEGTDKLAVADVEGQRTGIEPTT